jgi:hypothetical protein
LGNVPPLKSEEGGLRITNDGATPMDEKQQPKEKKQLTLEDLRQVVGGRIRKGTKGSDKSIIIGDFENSDAEF